MASLDEDALRESLGTVDSRQRMHRLVADVRARSARAAPGTRSARVPRDWRGSPACIRTRDEADVGRQARSASSRATLARSA